MGRVPWCKDSHKPTLENNTGSPCVDLSLSLLLSLCFSMLPMVQSRSASASLLRGNPCCCGM